MDMKDTNIPAWQKPLGYDLCRKLYESFYGSTVRDTIIKYLKSDLGDSLHHSDEILHEPQNLNPLRIVCDGSWNLFSQQLWTKRYTDQNKRHFRFDDDITFFRGKKSYERIIDVGRIYFDGVNKFNKGVIVLGDNMALRSEVYLFNSDVPKNIDKDQEGKFVSDAYINTKITQDGVRATAVAQDYATDRYAIGCHDKDAMKVIVCDGTEKNALTIVDINVGTTKFPNLEKWGSFVDYIEPDCSLKKIAFAGKEFLYALDTKGRLFKINIAYNKVDQVDYSFGTKNSTLDTFAIDPLNPRNMLLISKEGSRAYVMWFISNHTIQNPKVIKLKTLDSDYLKKHKQFWRRNGPGIETEVVQNDPLEKCWVWDKTAGLMFGHQGKASFDEDKYKSIHIFDLPGKLNPSVVTMTKFLPHLVVCALGGVLLLAKKVQEAVHA